MSKRTFVCLSLFVALSIAAGVVYASTSLTVPQLAKDIVTVEKQKIALTGTIAGACRSGCKVWLVEGRYKKGDPVILVWAKDNAFKFRTDATGRQVKLEGFAVGQYIDLCATEKKQEEGMKEGESCPKPEVLEKTKEKQLESITFFATSVEYL
ncbi:hypothetical protein SAMN02745165_01147 [Malonomonas rubra DSM 5091]|uniref:DUF5666 domain-containing protein n=1 Tax=Malonomonas rubra DSM 5091 TaxID=1122189 RepID=A0A1M6F3Z7_MALRU|nr:hypothetical protein [Malonomonas rubra]SHI92392.1 hypothetical protein SAMN02745165_01147 [Malonomonas rubra DSM 5091]